MKFSPWKPLLLATLAVSVLPAPAWALAPGIPAFRQVTPDIFRGARPYAEGIQELVQRGVKTDLDLENDPRAIGAEQAEAEQAGIKFVSREMSASETPSDAEVSDILSILEDPANYPVYVHCKLGEDRTGLIVALYRVLDQKWQPADAYAEWVQDGFHTRLTKLSDYFDQRTGYAP